jgi:ribonuclease T1
MVFTDRRVLNRSFPPSFFRLAHRCCGVRGSIRSWLSEVLLSVMAIFVASLFFAGTVQARTYSEELDVVALSALPVQAQSTYRLILAGGPFKYRHKDGSVFGNREQRLPKKYRGYYLEYTVETPGSSDRGARRIICGGRQPTTPDVCYYTQDHYASFRRIAP